MALLSINGVAIKTPSKFSVTISDFDGETTRNAKGELIRDRIGIKRKVDCEWPPMTQSEMSTLLNAVTAVFFTVQYLDPKDGVVTKTMYVGDRSAPMYKHGNGGAEVLWEGVKMNFVEK